MKKIVLLVLGLAILGGAATAYLMYNKEHADTAEAKSDFVLQANDLFTEFQADETTANGKYLDKVIEIAGTVREVSDTDDGSTGVMLATDDAMFGVSCSFAPEHAEAAKALKAGDEVRIKGVCTGILFDVVLKRCALATE